jgi:hypothetical protein
MVGGDFLFGTPEDDGSVAIDAFPYVVACLDAVKGASPGTQEAFPACHPYWAVISHGSEGFFE